MTNNTQALARYNRQFHNPQYQGIAHGLCADLHAERDAADVTDIMNTVTDCALHLSGYDDPNAPQRLTAVCAQHSLSDETMTRITRYLKRFSRAYDNTADDIAASLHALRLIHDLSPTLREAISRANGVHGWRGRAAYHLLSGADYLLQAAAQLLLHGNLFYIGRKLSRGRGRVADAVHECVLHSGRPDIFGDPDTL